MFIVEPAEHGYRNRTERDDGEFDGATIDAVNNQRRERNLYHSEFEKNRAGGERQQNTGKHGEPACQRDRRVVDFALAGVVHEIGAQAPFAPERQRQQRCQQRAGKGGAKKIEWKSHGWSSGFSLSRAAHKLKLEPQLRRPVSGRDCKWRPPFFRRRNFRGRIAVPDGRVVRAAARHWRVGAAVG